MYCIYCGTEVQEGWKACPKCGRKIQINEVIEKEQIALRLEKKSCGKCGAELSEDWTECPFCEQVLKGDCSKNENDDNDKECNSKEFEFEGFRRTGRFGFKYYPSKVEVCGDKVNTTVKVKKEERKTFSKNDIVRVTFPLLPIIGVLDIISMVLFGMMMFVSYGLSIFAILYDIKIILVRHMQIELRDGRKVRIPIRQKAESVEFLEAINYPEDAIYAIKKTEISSRKIVIREWITTTLLLVFGAIFIFVGMEMYISDRNSDSKYENDLQSEEKQTEVKTLEDVGGYEAWVESGHAAKIRTDIVVMLPVTKRQSDDYAVRIGSSFGDIIFIKQKDGTMATEWDWLMNAVPDVEDGDTATFQATLSLDGYVAVEGEKPVPKFIAEDIKSYSDVTFGEELDEKDKVTAKTWQEAYCSYIEKYGKKESTYSLIYVDDDNIPELILQYGSNADGMDICTYNGRQVNAKHIILSDIIYKRKDNLMLASGGHMDWYEDTVYEVKNGIFVEVSKGEYGEKDNTNIRLDVEGNPIYRYYWNDVEISSQEYVKRLEEEWSMVYNYVYKPSEWELYDIMKILKNPIDVVNIADYIHPAGYAGETNGVSIYFDNIENQELELRIEKDGILVAKGSVTIVDANKAEYHTENGDLIFEFDDYNYFKLTGNFEDYNLTDLYYGQWG